MSDGQEQHPPGDPDYTEIDMFGAAEYMGEINGEEYYAYTQSQPPTNKQQPPVNIKVNVHISKVKPSSSFLPNGIQIAGLLINGAMLLATYLLFIQTKKSVKISEDALTQTRINDRISNARNQESFELARTQYETSRFNDSLSFHNTIDQNRKALDVSQKSLQAQIESITETQSQFEIQNMPYLQVGNFRYVDDSTFAYTVSNLNQYPAKIAGIALAFGSVGSINPLAMQRQVGDPISGWSNTFKPVIDPLSENIYVIKESPIERIFKGYPGMASNINDRQTRLHGRIYYVDEGTKKKRLYTFSVILSGEIEEIVHEFRGNENKTIEGEFPQFINN